MHECRHRGERVRRDESQKFKEVSQTRSSGQVLVPDVRISKGYAD
jgi:hypothetical protein